MKKKPVPVDLATVDMNKLQQLSADLPSLMAYAHSVGGFAIVPTETGMIKSKAKQAMQKQTEMQLNMLYEQIQLIAKQAQRIKDRTVISDLIYEAQILFDPVIGEHYYLYQKEDHYILSLVSPDEWGKEKWKIAFIAKVELLADHTWEVLVKGDWDAFISVGN